VAARLSKKLSLQESNKDGIVTFDLGAKDGYGSDSERSSANLLEKLERAEKRRAPKPVK